MKIEPRIIQIVKNQGKGDRVIFELIDMDNPLSPLTPQTFIQAVSDKDAETMLPEQQTNANRALLRARIEAFKDSIGDITP